MFNQDFYDEYGFDPDSELAHGMTIVQPLDSDRQAILDIESDGKHLTVVDFSDPPPENPMPTTPEQPETNPPFSEIIPNATEWASSRVSVALCSDRVEFREQENCFDSDNATKVTIHSPSEALQIAEWLTKWAYRQQAAAIVAKQQNSNPTS